MKKVSRQRVNVRTHKAHKYGHKKTRPVVSMAPKAGETPRHARWASGPRDSLRLRPRWQKTNSKSAGVCLPELGKATKEP